MRALLYLIRKRFKNALISMLKSPGQLIFLIVMAALVVVGIFSGNAGHREAQTTGDPNHFFAIIFAFYALIFFLGIASGFRNGASFFTLADVNLVFNAPISNKKVLLYGLVRQLGMSLFAGFFVLFQYAWMRMNFGVTIGTLFSVLLGYGIVLFVAQILAMLIYACTSADERRQNLVKNLVYGAAIVVVVMLALPVFQAGLAGGGVAATLLTLSESIARPFVDFIPVIGWMKAFVAGVFMGNGLMALSALAGTALFAFGVVFIIFKLDADFYEDVLKSAEVTYSAASAQKQGRVQEVAPQNVRLGKEGLNGGSGASAFYFKHRIEGRRAKRLLFDTVTLIFMAFTLGFAYFTRDIGTLPAILLGAYTMVFSSFMGRWAKELLVQYVYLIPDKPFKKLIMILGETIRKNAVESVIIGVGIGVICGAGALETAAVVAARFSVALLFIAATILAERLFGGLPAKWMQMTFLILSLIICLIPSVTIAIVAGVVLQAPIWVCYLLAAAVAVGLSVLVTFLCRNVLTTAELNI
jgi:hypothetical protein